MDKYAGKEFDIMFEHFTNSAVYAFIIEDIIVTTVNKFHWNQNVILFLNRGATATMQLENLEKIFNGKKRIIHN